MRSCMRATNFSYQSWAFIDAFIDKEVLHVDHSYEATQLHLYRLLDLPLWAFIDAIIDNEFDRLVGSDIM